MEGAAACVVVFTTTGCPYCKRAKQALAEQQVAYQEVDVSGDAELRAALKDATGQSTVPQVYANGELVGGSDSLAAKIADGSLAQLLARPAATALLPGPLGAAAAAAAKQQQRQQQQQGPAAAGRSADLQRLVAALSDPSSGVPRQRHPEFGPSTFTGAALFDWLEARGEGGGGREAAAAAARRLLEANEVTLLAARQPPVSALSAGVADDGSRRYRLRRDAPRAVPWGVPLNTRWWWGPAPARPADVVAEELRGRVLALYDRHLSADGRAVSYRALAQDPDFWDYADATAELQRVDLSPLSREALMAFAVNMYNALVIHTLVAHGTSQYESPTGRVGFFQKGARYTIGGSDYTLDDLENGVLRGNRPAASSLGMLLKLPQLSKGPFRGDDPRGRHVVSPPDPRIHFALVCGAKSCPPIKLYSAATLEEGLQAAAESFCASDVAVDAADKRVTLSKIFSWYYVDFGADKAERLRWLTPYLPPPRRAELEALLADDPDARRITVQYAPYDWSINAAKE